MTVGCPCLPPNTSLPVWLRGQNFCLPHPPTCPSLWPKNHTFKMAGRLHSVHKNLWKLFKISPKYFYRISHPGTPQKTEKSLSQKKGWKSKVYLPRHWTWPPKNSVSENSPFENNYLSKGKPLKTNDKRQTTNCKRQTTNDKDKDKDKDKTEAQIWF